MALEDDPSRWTVPELEQHIAKWIEDAGLDPGLLGTTQFPQLESTAPPARTRTKGEWVRYVQIAPSRLEGKLHVYWGRYPVDPEATDEPTSDSQTYGSVEFARKFLFAWLVDLCETGELPPPA